MLYSAYMIPSLLAQKRLRYASLLILICALLVRSGLQARAQSGPLQWPEEWQADSAFYNLWSRADGPLAAGAVARSWVWGPQPFAVANESYAESSTGKRLVQYFDKARMEINDPAADRGSDWFVSSGLLVTEMVTGRVQTGNSTFETRQPATLPVAGDGSSPDAPTYADFAGVMAPTANAIGTAVAKKIGKGGVVSAYSGQVSADLFKVASYDDVSKHNVPGVFADALAHTGTVLEGGRLLQGQIIDPIFVLGRPITDAYWANVLVDGAPVMVLVQLFERRAVTYNPNNLPEWRVELANVGHAYYDWRYKDAPPGPAIAAQVGDSGVVVRGWNWPGPGTVSVRVDATADGKTVAGPTNVQADGSGRLAITLPYNDTLTQALQSGASLQVKASSGTASTALPLAGKPGEGNVHIEGTITLIEFSTGGTRMEMISLDGKGFRLNLPAGASITTAEGRPAAATSLDAGVAAIAEGNASNGVVAVKSIQLLSVSSGGVRVGYVWSDDGSSLVVTGSGWPGERDVIFALGTASRQTAFATLRSDSRGNLTGTIKLPRGADAQKTPWLFTSSTDKSGTQMTVAEALASLGSVATPPPFQLYISTSQGAEMGAAGAYCSRGKCVSSAGVTLHGDGLAVKAGEMLGLRSNSGSDTLFAPTATSLSVQLFRYPAASPQPYGSVYFTPSATPLYSIGGPNGKPFSVTLPGNLASGRYVMMVNVGWPDQGGGRDNGTYGFVIQVP